MPAHDPVRRDKHFEMHILVKEMKDYGRIPDDHINIEFQWHSGDRTWRIQGVVAPQTHLDEPKHNWQVYKEGLPQGQGEAILSFLEWLEGLYTVNV